MGRKALPLGHGRHGPASRSTPACRRRCAAFGRIDILVNNVGLGPGNMAENVNEADFDLTVAANLKGTFFASQAVGPGDDPAEVRADRQPVVAGGLRRAAGRGDLLHDQGRHLAPDQVSGRRMGQAQHHRQRRRADLHRRRPAPTRRLGDPAFRADVVERIAGLHRIGEPMDVAGAVVFLASPAAGMITGDTIMIDGGWTAR